MVDLRSQSGACYLLLAQRREVPMIATIVGLLFVVLGAGVFLVCLFLAIRWGFLRPLPPDDM